MRFTVSLSSSLENGEGQITNANKEKIKRLTFENPLLAADILKDWVFELSELYDVAVLEMQKDFDGTKSKQ
jgi:hypothetical protein